MTTVRWLMAQRRLALALRSGAAGLDRTLDCAVSSELVNAHEWLSGGEVLLTTGLRLPADPDARRAYVTNLADVGVAAIGFGVGLGLDAVPEEMIDAAERVGLPLFEVPLEIPFSAIARTVLDQIAAQRSSRLVAATRAQPRMTRAAAAGGSAAVVTELAEAVGQSVVLLDNALDVVAAAPRTASSTDLGRIRELVIRDPASAGAVWVTDDATMTVTRVGAAGATFGHLGVIGSEALDDVARMLLGHAVSLLAIERAKPRQVRRDVTELHADTLAAALSGTVRGDGIRRILTRGADRSGRIRLAVFAFPDDHGAATGARQLTELLEQRWREVFVHQDGTDVSVMLRGNDSTDVVTGLLTMMNAHGPVAGGVGPAVELDALEESARQARLACRSAAVGQLVDLAANRSLLTVDPVRQALGDLYPYRLAPLLDHDRDHGTDLRATLLAFLEANGNWGVAANSQGVHRHTLRHRIERIEDLLRVDLADARTRAELLLIMLGANA